MRRNKIGTSKSKLFEWKVEDFCQMQGPLAIQEYIQELIRNDPSDVKRIINPPKEVDLNVWLYEHLRQFILELNFFITQLSEVCTSESCPKMMVTSEWLFLCAAHKQPQECCAFDYMIHNLDQSTSILQNVKIYNSRVSISHNSVKNIPPIVRRLYRILSHTFFHHQQLLLSFENETHLCERFTYFALKYEMMTQDMLLIPFEIKNI